LPSVLYRILAPISVYSFTNQSNNPRPEGQFLS
jgi:hypothetical protein